MSTATNSTTRSARLLATAGVVLFVAAFFALPLYAVATMCHAPCCHRAAARSIVAELPACAAECSIQLSDATAARGASAVAPSPRVALIAPLVAPRAIAATAPPLRVEDSAPPPAHAAPLHLLNATFRI